MFFPPHARTFQWTQQERLGDTDGVDVGEEPSSMSPVGVKKPLYRNRLSRVVEMRCPELLDAWDGSSLVEETKEAAQPERRNSRRADSHENRPPSLGGGLRGPVRDDERHES